MGVNHLFSKEMRQWFDKSSYFDDHKITTAFLLLSSSKIFLPSIHHFIQAQ